ncbi:hypothetical protein, partial [Achromobacter ruhlandii]
HWKVGLYLSGIPPCHRCSHEDSFFVTGVVNDDYWASDSLGRIDGAPRQGTTRLGLRIARLVALLERGVRDDVCGARKDRPRGRPIFAYAVGLRRKDDAARWGRG